METYMGFRVAINPLVRQRTYLVSERDAVISFHDRYDLLQTMFWSNVTPRLNEITRSSWEEWKSVKWRQQATTLRGN